MKQYLVILSLMLFAGCAGFPLPWDTPESGQVGDHIEEYSGTHIEVLGKTYRDTQIECPDLKPVTLAQWVLESGRGSSKLAQEHNNYAGLKWRDEMKGWGVPVSYLAHDGRTEYIKFETPLAFIKGYWRFIDRSPYAGWRQFCNDPTGYLGHIAKAGYAEDKKYVTKVKSLIPEAKELLQ